MYTLKTLSVMAVVAGVAVAAPTPAEDAGLVKRWSHGYRWWSNGDDSTSLVVPPGWAPGQAAPTDTPSTTVVTVVTEVAGGAPAPSAPAAAAPATPTGSSSGASPTSGSSSGSGSYMDVVSKWRAAGGLPALTQDSTLEANALKTSTNSVGGLKHELNPGTMAQVLAPGNPTDFQDVYVGGWLCEIPSLPGLNGICSTLSQGWNYDGQTGHADILTSTSYSKIGCAIASDSMVWSCDLA
ncbi:uncharacterized protein PV06_09400 [Exophiala oligosperma]|uniref:SCP domain-containing protein n=1 Tax=Exophiala oligosperma TaxID=215243 RepID=A0A0D2DRY2_9EURO|nr:uncharacterized protein PV06_09400 [Exophiala oligosperma]KIW38439.1 hypothetical protein PV06_09400 [Exophiala oligosperma]